MRSLHLSQRPAPGSICPFRRRICLFVFTAVALVGASRLTATPPVIRVEEDWELRLLQPHPNTETPQVTCVMSPNLHTRGVHAAFDVNHRTQPDYVAGGTQLQVWNGEYPVAFQKGPQDKLLQNDGETIRWTQQMRLSDGKLIFEILNGSSATWGTFGGQGYLKLSVDSSLGSLSGYLPSVSAKNSGIGYAANRVDRLIIREVRAYTAEGLLATWSEPIVVHQHD